MLSQNTIFQATVPALSVTGSRYINDTVQLAFYKINNYKLFQKKIKNFLKEQNLSKSLSPKINQSL
jgi:hypothetical protein